MDTEHDLIMDSLCDHLFPVIDELYNEGASKNDIVIALSEDHEVSMRQAKDVLSMYEENVPKEVTEYLDKRGLCPNCASEIKPTITHGPNDPGDESDHTTKAWWLRKNKK